MLASSDPRQICVTPPASPSPSKQAESGRLAPLLLLVDDCPEDTALYADHLIAAGFRVEIATSGAEGVKLSLLLVPDLVVMDLQMPGIDGWEATRLLGCHDQTLRIPILALSGFHATPMVMRAIRAGCCRFVPKPCLAEELEAVIRSTLGRRDEAAGG